MKTNLEDVVQAALILHRWCKEHRSDDGCDCPFVDKRKIPACAVCVFNPGSWKLEEFLRTRGTHNAD